MQVFKHGHESATGRTSSIGQHNLCVGLLLMPMQATAFLARPAEVAVQDPLRQSQASKVCCACSWMVIQDTLRQLQALTCLLCMQLDAKGGVLNDSLFRTHSCADYIARSSKVVTLVDLAGHERYFKTTAYGLTGHLPDYACLIIGANAGELDFAFPIAWVLPCDTTCCHLKLRTASRLHLIVA